MVIDSNSGIQNTGSSNPRSRVSTSTEGQTSVNTGSDSPAAKAEVSLSSTGQQMNRLEAEISASTDVDSDRVDALRKAIAEGSFAVDAERIAERMLDQDDLFA